MMQNTDSWIKLQEKIIESQSFKKQSEHYKSANKPKERPVIDIDILVYKPSKKSGGESSEESGKEIKIETKIKTQTRSDNKLLEFYEKKLLLSEKIEEWKDSKKMI